MTTIYMYNIYLHTKGTYVLLKYIGEYTRAPCAWWFLSLYAVLKSRKNIIMVADHFTSD